MSDHLPPATPTPSAKRRRVDLASSTLKRPFRSPLLTRPPGSAPPPAFALATPTRAGPDETPTKAVPRTLPTPRRTPQRRPLFAAAHTDPELAAAQKRHTALLNDVRAARTRLETVAQARALEAKPERDERLAADVRKWRAAARDAAETLFGIAGDKINRMGGPGGDQWRGMVLGKARGGGGFGWDEDERKKGSGDDEDEAQYEEEPPEEEAAEWGMGLMLKTLGIPWEMLGWDEEAGSWQDEK